MTSDKAQDAASAMVVFEQTFPHLSVAQSSLRRDVGRQVRYTIPTNAAERAEFLRQHGTVVLGTVFTIIGVQRNWRGDEIYRCTWDGDEQVFGRPLDPALLRDGAAEFIIPSINQATSMTTPTTITQRDMTGVDITPEEVLAYTPANIFSVYSGKDGKCCCGCSGAYRYMADVVESGAAAKHCGYEVETSAINERQVAKVLDLVKAAVRDGTAEYGSNNVAAVVGERLYIIYPRA